MKTIRVLPPECVAVRRQHIEDLRSQLATLYAVATAAREEYAEIVNRDLTSGSGVSHETMMFFALLEQATRARNALEPLTRLL